MSESMIHSVVVRDPIGLHARPVGQIVKAVKESGLVVTLRTSAGAEASATSALRMLALKVKHGESIDIIVKSEDLEVSRTLAITIEALINEG